jgi:hypothetical protein
MWTTVVSRILAYLVSSLFADLFVDGGFFVFGDLSVKIEGNFRLKFTLFEMRK